MAGWSLQAGIAATALGDGHVTGNSIGCVTDPLFGYKGKVQALGKGYVLDLAYAGALIWFIGANNTWEIYDAAGNFINAGTWSPGAPALKGSKPAAQK